MKRRTIILVVTALIIISLIVPYLAPKVFSQYLGSVSTLFSLFSTMLTLVLAMILYNQLGLDQTLLQKKAEVVFKLLDLLNERHFEIKTNTDFNIFIHLSTISKYKKGYEKYGHIKLLFDKNYLDCIYPIIELEDNVFLPKELFHKILLLEANSFQAEKNKIDDKEFGTVVSYGHKLEVLSGDHYSNISANEWGSILLLGNDRTLISEITLKEFIERWDDLIISSVNWINRYSSYQELNIPFFRDYYKTN